MKKLVIVACAVAFAAVAQAGTVSWTCLGVNGPNGSALGTGHPYVFFCDSAAAAQSGITAFINAAEKKTTFLTLLDGANWDDSKKTTAAGNFDIGTTNAMGKYTLPTPTSIGLSDGTKYYMYMVITDTDAVADTTKYMVAQGAATTTGASTPASSSGSNVPFGLANQAENSKTWYAVAAVPEPTSGLLLLLGVAGLALRRRRA